MFTICIDTICTGYSPITVECEGVSKPIEFKTEYEAEEEMKSDPEFYEDCFVCRIEEIGHKTIFTGED